MAEYGWRLFVGLMIAMFVIESVRWWSRRRQPPRRYEVYVIGTKGEHVVAARGLTRREAKELAYSLRLARNIVKVFVRGEGSSRG